MCKDIVFNKFGVQIFFVMNTPQIITQLADARIAEAECLFTNKHYDFAFYTVGYAIELYLRARIATILNIPNFFDFENRNKFINEDSITKPYKVHNYYQLLILSGLYYEHEKMLADGNFKSVWGKLRLWKEDLRYYIGKEQKETFDFINSVKNYSVWIKNYL